MLGCEGSAMNASAARGCAHQITRLAVKLPSSATNVTKVKLTMRIKISSAMTIDSIETSGPSHAAEPRRRKASVKSTPHHECERFAKTVANPEIAYPPGAALARSLAQVRYRDEAATKRSPRTPKACATGQRPFRITFPLQQERTTGEQAGHAERSAMKWKSASGFESRIVRRDDSKPGARKRYKDAVSSARGNSMISG